MKINLLPQELQPSKALRNTVLVVLAVLVLVIAPAVYYGYDLNMQVRALEEEHSTWQTEFAAHSEIARLVQERDALAKEVEQAEKAAGVHEQFKATLYLNELTSRMPASVSVTDITLSSGSMSLLGSTKDYQGIADFLGALVACDLFGERPLLSYLTRGADGYRFALTVELMGGVTP